MRRRVKGIWVAGLAVLLAVVGFSATAANAQSTVRFAGSFTLPCEASWGTAVLPPGDYTLTVNSVSKPSFIRIDAVRSNEHVFVSQWATGDKLGNQNMIVLTVTGRSCEVRALNLADLGMEITYKPMSKAELALLHRGRLGRLLALDIVKH